MNTYIMIYLYLQQTTILSQISTETESQPHNIYVFKTIIVVGTL